MTNNWIFGNNIFDQNFLESEKIWNANPVLEKVLHLAKNLKKINNREKEGGGEEGGKANPPTPIHTNAEKWYKIMVDSTSGQG